MPRKLGLKSKSVIAFRLFFILLCLTVGGMVEARALVPCSAPTAAGFRVRTLPPAISGELLDIVSADFNGDGKMDLAVPVYTSNQFNDSIRTYLGDGMGGFTLAGGATSIARPIDLVVADFTSDGRPDLAVSSGSTIQILHNLGDGSFTSVVTYTVQSGGGMAAGDFNSDGKQDLAVIPFAVAPGRVSVLMGFGTGTFAAPVDTPTGSTPSDIKTGDFNSDGKQDIITISDSTGQLSLLLNNGTGNFALPVNLSSGLNLPSSIAVADFNNDGKPDVAVGNMTLNGVSFNPPSMSILLGNGTGGFSAGTVLNLGVNFREVIAGDFTGDGNIDIAGATFLTDSGRYVPGTVVTLAGNGAGGFTVSNTAGVGYVTRALTSGDFNNDGRPDLAVTNTPLNMGFYFDISVLIGSCNYPHIKTDYDGDGKTDYAIWRPSNGNWIIQQSSNSAFRVQQWGMNGDVPVQGDYDGDGKTDLAVFRNGVWYVLRSSDGSFFGVQWGASGDKPVQGDYDGDRKTDLAVYRPSTGAWYVLRSSDSSFFGVAFGLSTDKVVPGDYDGDGKNDVAVWRPSDGYWYILNSSDGSFRAEPWGTNGDVPVPGDYNGDSRTDLAVYRPSNNRWYVYRPDAPTQYLEYRFSGAAETPTPGDYDGDGLTDVSLWRPSSGAFETFRSFTGQVGSNGVIGNAGDIPVSTLYPIE